MAHVATLAGKVIATGIKWGGREGAWLAEMPGRVGTASFEGGHPPRGTIPAAALAGSVIRPEHEFDPCLVALVCDDGENWLTVVMTDRAPSLLSEHEYSDAGSWKLAIRKALANASISRVYVPENSEVTVEDDNDKIVLFSQAELVAGAGIRPLRRRGRWRWLLAIGAAVAVTGSVLSLWVLFASNSNPPETATQATPAEVTRLDVAALLRHCADALAEFWPMAPEWSLSEEGCVLDPVVPAKLGVVTDAAFAYRVYRLDRLWNTFLAGQAAMRVVNNFQGMVIQEARRVVLYSPARTERIMEDAGFRPEVEVAPILERLFTGDVSIQSSRLANGALDIETSLELRVVLQQMKGVDLEPVWLRQSGAGQGTKMRVRPVQLRTERSRVSPSPTPAS